MKFYKKLIRVFDDLPNHTSLLVHSLVGCNLKCLGCHNYEDLIENKDIQESITPDELIQHIKMNGFLFDAIIFSGGEFLLEKLDDISNLLIKIRDIFDGKIIVNSNGSFPEKIKFLLDNKLVDGIHLDMKLPYHLLNTKQDAEIYNQIIGLNPSDNLIHKFLQSTEFVIENGSKYSQIRTVKYPLLSEEFFVETQKYINELNLKHHKNVPYFLNDFVDINEK